MSGQGNSRIVAVSVVLAIGLGALYVNNPRYGYAAPTQVGVKADWGLSEKLQLPPDLWPR